MNSNRAWIVRGLTSLSFWACVSVSCFRGVAQDLEVEKTPAPDREGDNDTSCPPGPGNDKADPTHEKDKDVNGDERDDYFMGSWKFVKGDKDIIITKWCVNNPPDEEGRFQDFFTYQIETSDDGVPNDPPAIPAGPPT